MDSLFIIAKGTGLCQAPNYHSLDKLSGVDLHAGAHGGADHAGADVLALGSGRLGLHNGVHQGVEVLLQLLGAERSLADRAMDDIGLKIVANIVMVGAITKITEVISKDAAIESIKASVPAGTEDKNIAAFEAGYNF